MRKINILGLFHLSLFSLDLKKNLSQEMLSNVIELDSVIPHVIN